MLAASLCSAQETAKPIRVTRTGVKDTVQLDTERKGPTNLTFGEWQMLIRSDYNFGAGHNFVNINRTVYRDANPKSGYFYYLPAAYTLNWSKESGYAFHVNYLTAGPDGRGNVIITAELKPNITQKDLELARLLLKRDLSDESEKTFKDLISMPLAGSPKVSFKQQFGEAISDVQINVSSDFLRPITLSWKMDRVDDLLSAMFNNIGLNGEIIISPGGENMPSEITIPITLKLDSHETFGLFEPASGWRSGWTNPAPYPIKLKNLHVLRLDKYNGDEPRVYTWDLGGKEVPEKAKVQFDASLVPAWIDTDPLVKKMWLEYTVVPCISCNNTVKDGLIRGTSGRRVNKIEFTLLTPLSSTGTSLMKIKTRSFQADPNGLSKVQHPTLTVNADNSSVTGGELFVSEGEAVDFEYMIELYKSDGTKYASPVWQRSNSLEVIIGKKQIQEMIPEFKNLK
ncbi:MAG: hypothetical protein EAZ89_07000 [Bacteroidetes bacterium]|nr:MAG: hypothetical protein EAZ89_07000 [Bacteroidota bacterium]